MLIQEQVLAVRADGQSNAEVDQGLLSVLTLRHLSSDKAILPTGLLGAVLRNRRSRLTSPSASFCVITTQAIRGRRRWTDPPQTTSVEQAGSSNLLPEAQPVSSRKLAAKSVADQWKRSASMCRWRGNTGHHGLPSSGHVCVTICVVGILSLQCLWLRYVATSTTIET